WGKTGALRALLLRCEATRALRALRLRWGGTRALRALRLRWGRTRVHRALRPRRRRRPRADRARRERAAPTGPLLLRRGRVRRGLLATRSLVLAVPGARRPRPVVPRRASRASCAARDRGAARWVARRRLLRWRRRPPRRRLLRARS